MLNYIKPALQQAVPPGTQIVYVQDPAQNPDLLIYSMFGDRHRRYNCRTVLLSGEAWDVSRHRPNLVIDTKNVPRFRSPGAPVVYCPFYIVSFVERFQNRVEDLIKPPTYNPESILATKNKFCAFLYSQNVDFRNSLYDVISRYKPVDALGRCRGPANRPVDRQVYEVGRRTYNDLAVQKYRPYKFVICCENSRHPGYITEKMISAMLANCIPIYLGAPDVVEHFNPASFIHVGAYPNWEHAVAKIKELDQNPSAWCAMLREPWFRDNKFNRFFDQTPLVQAFQQVLALPPNSGGVAQRVPRMNQRRAPRLGSMASRTARTALHHRVAITRAIRAPTLKMGSAAAQQARTRMLARRRAAKK